MPEYVCCITELSPPTGIMRSLLLVLGATLLVSALFPATHAQCEPQSQCTELKSWRQTLFNRLYKFATYGKTYTRLLVFKETAHVALSGLADADSIIALAKLGTGRVAALTHPLYVQNFGKRDSVKKIRKFHNNLLAWLKDGKTQTWEICKPTSSQELSACLDNPDVRTLLWVDGVWTTAADNDRVKTWVEQEGGTLVHGFEKAKFEAATAESARHIPFYSTLLAAGIAYEAREAQVPDIIYTYPTDGVSHFIYLNFKNAIDSLTWSNFENFEESYRLRYFEWLVLYDPRYFPSEISNQVFSLIEPFATAMEVNMVWPDATPSNKVAVSVNEKQKFMFRIYYALGLSHLWKPKAPNLDKFPGDVPEPLPSTETASFSFDSRRRRYFFSTGYYLVAGQEMTITINNPLDDNAWQKFELYIGMYTDSLINKNELLRFPRIVRVSYLRDREMTIRWLFGGLVYMRGPPELGNKLMMTISGVIPTPHLDITVDQDFDATWAARCQAPGLTADIRSEWVRFTLPVEDSGICEMSGTQVQDLLAKWDKVVLKNWELRGEETWYKAQSFTCDIQLFAGFLHSGFPIVGDYMHCNKSLDINYMSGKWAEHWGPFHELGHNVDPNIWIYNNIVIETTPNIFSYFQMERMAGYNWDTLPLLHKHINSDEMTNWLADPSFDNPNYDTFIRLVVYTQTIRDFGWSCQKEMMNGYWDNPAEPHPTTDHEEIQQWVLRYSRVVGYNLCPLFGTFWKWPLDAETYAALDHLVPYLPDDIVTQRADAAALTQLVETTWAPRLVRTIDNPPNCEPFDIEAL